ILIPSPRRDSGTPSELISRLSKICRRLSGRPTDDVSKSASSFNKPSSWSWSCFSNSFAEVLNGAAATAARTSYICPCRSEKNVLSLIAGTYVYLYLFRYVGILLFGASFLPLENAINSLKGDADSDRHVFRHVTN